MKIYSWLYRTALYKLFFYNLQKDANYNSIVNCVANRVVFESKANIGAQSRYFELI